MKECINSDEDFLFAINLMFEPLCLSDLSKDDFINNGILVNWLEKAMEVANKEYALPIIIRISAIEFIINIWFKYPSVIENQET